jgi:hypothetical protein
MVPERVSAAKASRVDRSSGLSLRWRLLAALALSFCGLVFGPFGAQHFNCYPLFAKMDAKMLRII